MILGPGPSSANPRVLRAMSQPIIGYLDPAYFDVLGSVQEMLRYVFATEQTTMTVAGSGIGRDGGRARKHPVSPVTRSWCVSTGSFASGRS